jgi:hypothetical protein
VQNERIEITRIILPTMSPQRLPHPTNPQIHPRPLLLLLGTACPQQAQFYMPGAVGKGGPESADIRVKKSENAGLLKRVLAAMARRRREDVPVHGMVGLHSPQAGRTVCRNPTMLKLPLQ